MSIPKNKGGRTFTPKGTTNTTAPNRYKRPFRPHRDREQDKHLFIGSHPAFL